MNIDSADLLLQHEWPIARAFRARSRRLGLRLTLAERRLLLEVVDLLLVNGALVTALTVWGGFPLSTAALLDACKWFVTLSIVWLILGAALDVNNPVRATSATQSVLYVGLAALLVGVLYLAIPWLTPPLGRRLQAFGFIALAVVGVAGWRALYARYFFQSTFRHRVLVVGDGTANRALVHELQSAASAERADTFHDAGYLVVGFVEDEPDPQGEATGAASSLAANQNLIHEARRLGADEIIVADGGPRSPMLREAILDCWELGLPVTPLSVAYERLRARLPVDYAGWDLSIIAETADSPAERLYRASKRAIDILIAMVGVGLMGMLSPFVVLANALTSPGPLFYRQERVGRGGRPFVLLKFRTMVLQAEQEGGAVWAAKADSRVTPVGRWLRQTRLDEFPQFINVLRGEMSVVGPRPERPQFVGELVHFLPLYRARHAVPPGITGWAQVRYRYGNSVEDARIKLEYDLYYVKHAGFFLDLLILLQTIPAMLHLRGY